MKERIIAGYLSRKLACMDALKRFGEEEKGSDLVVAIIMIVIAIAVAAVFRTQLLGAVNLAFEKLTEFMGS